MRESDRILSKLDRMIKENMGKPGEMTMVQLKEDYVEAVRKGDLHKIDRLKRLVAVDDG